MSIGEKLSLFIKVKIYFLKQQMKTFFKYYRNPSFGFCDLFFIFLYLFKNPFVISRKFLQKKGEDNIYTYGETPYCTLEKIATSFDIRSSDTVVELGAGRGKTLFWLSHFVGCKTIGVEWIPIFVKKGSLLAKFFGKNKVSFLLDDMFKIDLKEASVVYLYGTCMEDSSIRKLIQKLSSYSDLKIITISFSLSQYSQKYTTEKEIAVSFPWGETTAYLNTFKGANNV